MDSVQMVSSDGVRLSILRQPVSAGPASHVRSMAAATKQHANTQLWLGVLSGCSCDAADKADCCRPGAATAASHFLAGQADKQRVTEEGERRCQVETVQPCCLRLLLHAHPGAHL